MLVSVSNIFPSQYSLQESFDGHHFYLLVNVDLKFPTFQ